MNGTNSIIDLGTNRAIENKDTEVRNKERKIYRVAKSCARPILALTVGTAISLVGCSIISLSKLIDPEKTPSQAEDLDEYRKIIMTYALLFILTVIGGTTAALGIITCALICNGPEQYEIGNQEKTNNKSVRKKDS